MMNFRALAYGEIARLNDAVGQATGSFLALAK